MLNNVHSPLRKNQPWLRFAQLRRWPALATTAALPVAGAASNRQARSAAPATTQLIHDAAAVKDTFIDAREMALAVANDADYVNAGGSPNRDHSRSSRDTGS